MIELCREAGLPAPDFELRAGSFVLTLWRDWLTEATVDKLKLNDRQKKAVAALKTAVRMTNRSYQELTGVSESTALRDLGSLETKRVIQRVGMTGRNAYYVIGKKPFINPSNPSSSHLTAMTTNATP